MMLYGLKRGWEQRGEKFKVVTDSRNVVGCIIIMTLKKVTLIFEDLMEYKRLIHMPWTCTMVYTSRESNRVANFLAKMGHHLDTPKLIFEDPSLEMAGIFMKFSFFLA